MLFRSYQMLLTYQSSRGTRHALSGGGYQASLVLSPSDLAVASIQASGSVSPVQRPAAATDQAAKDLVSKAMAQCAAARIDYPPDCPQQLVAVDISNLRWTLNGDPVTPATVTFDDQSGEVTVHGPFNMQADYSSFGVSHSDRSLTHTFNAVLMWTGQALQLVTIEGSMP